MAALPPDRIVDRNQLDTTRARALFALGIVFPPLTTFFVGVRLYSRHMKRAKYGADDWLLVSALIFYYTLTAALFIMIYPAWNGHHTDAVPDPSSALEWSTQVGFYSILSYALVATCIRCSTCMLFIRIFIQRSYRRVAYANLGFNICWGIYSVLVTIFQCSPVVKALRPTIPGQCINEKSLLLSLTIWGVVCDAVTWTLPVPMIWRLHAPLSTKIGLTGILALGLVAVVIGGLRIWTVVTVSFEDPLWAVPLATYWAYTETGLGIICAAAASIAPPFQRFFVSPLKTMFAQLRSLVSIQSDLVRNDPTEDTDHLSGLTMQQKSDWSLNTGTQGSHDAYVHALKHTRDIDAHLGEVTMQTEISVVQEE